MKGLKELIARIRGEATLTEDQVQEELNKILPETWVPKTKFNELLGSEKLAKDQLEATNKQLEELKKNATLTEEQKNQLKTLEDQVKAQNESHAAELKKIRLDHAIETALSKAKSKNVKATRALLDEQKIILGDDGQIAGLNEQLEAIKKDNGYLFEADPDGNGNNPPAQNLPRFGGNRGGVNPTTEQALTEQFTAALLGKQAEK